VVIPLVLADVALLLAEPLPQPRRRALLVGVSTYSQAGFADHPLPFSAPDMELLAEILRQHGWQVQLLTSKGSSSTATRAHILAALDKLLEGARASDLILVGLSGHGQQFRAPVEVEEGKVEVREEAFFCPSDAEKVTATTMLGMTELTRRLGRKGGQNLVLVDACRDDPRKGGIKGVDGIAVRDLPENTSILFSCRSGQQSFETNQMYGQGSSKGHGVFFHRILKGLQGEARNRQGEVTWDSLQSYVREHVNRDALQWFPERAVELASGKKVVQTPHLAGSLIDEPPVLVRLKDGADTRAEREEPLELDLGGGVKLKLVRIPAAGQLFWMGSPKSEKDRNPWEQHFDAEEQHPVELTRDFWLAVTETTQAQFQALMGKNPSYFSAGGDGKARVEGQDTRSFPVENVSWENAQDFCGKLNEKFRGRGLLFRLPTEAEWEYAARGGAANKDSLPFHFQEGPTGSLSSRQANFNGGYPYGDAATGSSLGRTTRTGSYSANRFGLYDMHGNVWEWCQDYYGPYNKLTTNKDPVQNEKQVAGRRVLRGGSWYYDGADCRAAGRLGGVPSDRDPVGFRVAASPRNP